MGSEATTVTGTATRLLIQFPSRKKAHVIQAGIDLKWSDTDLLQASSSQFPSYSFTGQFTGNAFADFLLGLPGSVNRTNSRPTINSLRRTWGFYIQDDWRVTPRLTFNLGDRIEYIAPVTANNSMYYNFDPKTGNLVVPNQTALGVIDPSWPLATNPIVTASQAGFPAHLMNGTFRPATPRIGFAFRPFNNDRTVVRGGWGMYNIADLATGYVLAEYGATSLMQPIGPFALSTYFTNSFTNGTPALQWPLGFPTSGAGLSSAPGVTGINPNFRYPYNQQWNFTIEREIHGQGLRLSYIGTKDTKLG